VGRTLDFPKGSIVAINKGYTDYGWYNQLNDKGVFFVTRLKTNAKYRVIARHPLFENFSNRSLSLSSTPETKILLY